MELQSNPVVLLGLKMCSAGPLLLLQVFPIRSARRDETEVKLRLEESQGLAWRVAFGRSQNRKREAPFQRGAGLGGNQKHYLFSW